MTVSNEHSPEFIQEICRLAERAGEAILEVYDRDDFDVRVKSDDSPLTEADLASNRIIVAGLKELSDLPILSEESKQAPWSERKRWSRFWLVDPLDGTKEFVKRNGEFTVNIALIDDGRPTLGVVHVPALGRTFRASSGAGAFARDDDGDRRLSVTDPIETPVTVVVSRSHLRDDDREFIARLEEHFGAVELRRTGSSLKLCLVAEGGADVYPRFGPTSVWDIAAAHCVVTEAGGVVEDPNGDPLRYHREALLNPFFIVRSTALEPFWRLSDS